MILVAMEMLKILTSIETFARDHFVGYIYDAKFYNTSLSDADVSNCMGYSGDTTSVEPSTSGESYSMATPIRQ